MTEEEIKDRIKKVCICRSVSKGTILDAVKNGAKTFEDIKKRTGAGTGNCKATRCGDKIRDILKDKS